MNKILKYYPLITWWACALLLVSLVFSKFLLTVAMIALVAVSVLHPDSKSHFKKAFTKPFFLIWILILLMYAASGFYSANTHELVNRLRIKLPFLIMPIAFAGLISFQKREFKNLLWLFFSCIVLCSCYSFVRYLINFETINQGYSYAQVIPTPLDHIRFSILVAIAVMVGIYLTIENYETALKWQFYVSVIGTVFLFLFLHLLAVRSGLLAIYLAALYLIIYLIFEKRKWIFGGLGFVLLLCVFSISIQLFPTLRSKIGYMKYDLTEFFKGNDVNGHSDGGRLLSLKIGKEIIVQHPLTGVGAGDVETEMHRIYETTYPTILEKNRMVPHNQFIYVWAATGILGFLLFIVLVVIILFHPAVRNNWLYASVAIINVSALFTEPTLEIQIGTAIFIFFTFFFYNQFKKETAKA